MNVNAITQAGAPQTEPPGSRRVQQAARDFEALLVSEMLKTSHGDAGWLGTGDDQSDDAALGMGEEQLAQALANGGGLGLAKMIEADLARGPGARAESSDMAR